MNPQEYILKNLDELRAPVVAKTIPDADLESAVYGKVMSKKFRKLSADAQAADVTRQAVRRAIQDNAPLKMNLIFGGNKLWRFDEAPEIDWAELFTCMYMAQWMRSIASVYAPGVYLEFYSEDVVLEAMNNQPKSETDRYSESFKAMLSWFSMYLPENVGFGYKRYGDEYDDYPAFLADLEVAKAKVLEELGGKLPELDEKKISKIDLNVQPQPGQTDDPLWREKVELTHLSIERTPVMERYINDPSWVPVCPANFPGCVVTGSTKNSLAKFWVAVGALMPADEAYMEVVLTPKQLAKAEYEWQDVDLNGLQGRNFRRIRVLA